MNNFAQIDNLEIEDEELDTSVLEKMILVLDVNREEGRKQQVAANLLANNTMRFLSTIFQHSMGLPAMNEFLTAEFYYSFSDSELEEYGKYEK